eukprot:IDg8936t1
MNSHIADLHDPDTMNIGTGLRATCDFRLQSTLNLVRAATSDAVKTETATKAMTTTARERCK